MDEVTDKTDTIGTDTRTNTAAGSAPGPLPDHLYGPLPDWEFKLTPTSTQVIMASLFLALGFTVNMQITERIDTVMWGGVSPLWGLFFFALWNLGAAIFFGIPGALIVANINPIVANLTATNPLAPTFFATNTLYAVPMALWAWYFKEPGKGLTVKQLGIAHLLSIPLAVVPLAFIWAFVLNFTPAVIAMWYVGSCIFGWTGFFVAYPFAKKLLESGVVQR
jgi:hypothetical protein